MPPKIICLCGSIRFKKTFMLQYERLSMTGAICLLPVFTQASEEVSLLLDELHKEKIKICDEIFVVNPNNYIGEGLKRELEYAQKLKKSISYLELWPENSTKGVS